GLDMIKVSNDTPIYLPWIFRHLGPAKFSFLYGNYGPSQKGFPYSYVTAYKLSFEPTSFFEFGLATYDQAGGDGSIPASMGDRILNSFPIVNVLVYPFKDLEVSNRLASADFRFRIPPARNLELYTEITFDDVDVQRLKST
ncbi:MAG TPA: capsule assembly Wzi family protein, partial [Pyrinomonadaceae bacterium]|nr:capsule assembly Wzi family protein [Pyrinomonadaceae bacterium]